MYYNATLLFSIERRLLTKLFVTMSYYLCSIDLGLVLVLSFHFRSDDYFFAEFKVFLFKKYSNSDLIKEFTFILLKIGGYCFTWVLLLARSSLLRVQLSF